MEENTLSLEYFDYEVTEELAEVIVNNEETKAEIDKLNEIIKELNAKIEAEGELGQRESRHLSGLNSVYSTSRLLISSDFLSVLPSWSENA